MKNIVIAAGYATRLGELTRNFPKPLLKIGESTILGRMLDDIDSIPEIDEHIIITNHKFAPIFEEWKAELHYTKPVTIVDDGTETNETRNAWRTTKNSRRNTRSCILGNYTARVCSPNIGRRWKRA